MNSNLINHWKIDVTKFSSIVAAEISNSGTAKKNQLGNLAAEFKKGCLKKGKIGPILDKFITFSG